MWLKAFGLATILLTVMMLAFTSECGKSRSPMSTDEIENMIQRELPSGSSATEVINYLDRQKITHSDLSKIPESDTAYRELEIANKAAIQDYIVATVPRTGRTGVVTWNIQMYFFFDRNQSLVAHRVKQLGTSF